MCMRRSWKEDPPLGRVGYVVCIRREYARLSTSDHTGIFTDKQQKAADVDNNGAIDAVDASKILSYYAYASTNDYPMSIENYLS